MSDRIIIQKWSIHNITGLRIVGVKDVPLVLTSTPAAITSPKRFLMVVNFGAGTVWAITGDQDVLAVPYSSFPILAGERIVVDVGSTPNGPTHASVISDKAIDIWVDQGVGEA